VDVTEGKNVINDPYSFSVSAADITTGAQAQPRWVNAGEQVLVPTRYQLLVTEAQGRGLHCFDFYSKDYCISDQHIAKPYTTYNWTDSTAHTWMSIAQSIKKADSSEESFPVHTRGRPLQLHVETKINVCFVGDSHSRELFFTAQRAFKRNRIITFTFVPSIFPLVFSAEQLENNFCSVAVMSFGQWSLSPYAESPVTIDAIQSELQAAFAETKNAIARIFFRSENYNGIGGHVRFCPHKDFRTPRSTRSTLLCVCYVRKARGGYRSST
jgi:hypothetical protein